MRRWVPDDPLPEPAVTVPGTPAALSLDDFLAWENAQPGRNEFHRGVVHAKADLRRVHGCVISNLVRALGDSLQGSPCQVFAHSMKLQIDADTIVYPDVFVTCDPADLRTEMIFRAPTLVVEMPGPSVPAGERSERRAIYRRVESLREWVLIDPESRSIECWRRHTEGDWQRVDLVDASELHFQSVDCRMPFADVFDGVEARVG